MYNKLAIIKVGHKNDSTWAMATTECICFSFQYYKPTGQYALTIL